MLHQGLTAPARAGGAAGGTGRWNVAPPSAEGNSGAESARRSRVVSERVDLPLHQRDQLPDVVGLEGEPGSRRRVQLGQRPRGPQAKGPAAENVTKLK